MAQKFKGRLRSKKPQSLIKENQQDYLDDFFLSLALIFNDLKGIILFQDLLNKTYQAPGPEINEHDGEFGGLNMQIVRILSGLINEFLVLLKENSIIDSESFQKRLSHLKPEDQKLWNELIAVSKARKIKDNPTIYALMMIRGNITFHYENAGKNLRQGYITRFYKKKRSKALKNLAAYYSLEDSLEATRFYYADAAAEEYMMIISSGWNNYMRDINQLVRAIHRSIYFIMKEYLKDKM